MMNKNFLLLKWGGFSEDRGEQNGGEVSKGDRKGNMWEQESWTQTVFLERILSIKDICFTSVQLKICFAVHIVSEARLSPHFRVQQYRTSIQA